MSDSTVPHVAPSWLPVDEIEPLSIPNLSPFWGPIIPWKQQTINIIHVLHQTLCNQQLLLIQLCQAVEIDHSHVRQLSPLRAHPVGDVALTQLGGSATHVGAGVDSSLVFVTPPHRPSRKRSSPSTTLSWPSPLSPPGVLDDMGNRCRPAKMPRRSS